MLYEKAVKYLSESIEKDANDKQAYFDRALANFETGNFEEAIQDYLTSDQGKIVLEPSFLPTAEFISDFPSPEYKTDCKIIVLPYPKKIPNNGFCAYKRYEASSCGTEML